MIVSTRPGGCSGCDESPSSPNSTFSSCRWLHFSMWTLSQTRHKLKRDYYGCELAYIFRWLRSAVSRLAPGISTQFIRMMIFIFIVHFSSFTFISILELKWAWYPHVSRTLVPPLSWGPDGYIYNSYLMHSIEFMSVIFWLKRLSWLGHIYVCIPCNTTLDVLGHGGLIRTVPSPEY